ncbi:hypothetical protein LZ24_03227 [Desulfobotulus alkaliphilus]|uniref:Fibronectin type-III domain-containing protein n=2 Tax=Desulfobotulus alkaliphilus TaxID=622671 RepID=A0A562R4D6_9BACT|nr:hypothetical protein LZ24_03227 [Desulfobotulus alkaliphilus]
MGRLEAGGLRWGVFFLLILVLTGCRLPAVENFKAEALRTEPGVRLTWTPVAHKDLAGYWIYRKAQGQAEALNLSSVLLPGDTRLYVDRSVTHGVVYEYAVVAVDRRLQPGRPSDGVKVFAAWNATTLSRPDLDWQDPHVKISWPCEDFEAYELSRSETEAGGEILGKGRECQILDDLSAAFTKWHYRVRGIRVLADPLSGGLLELPGPWSPGARVEAHAPDAFSLGGCTRNKTGDWALNAGVGLPVTLSASVLALEGEMKIRAVSGEHALVSAGSGSGFSLALPALGAWRVSVWDSSGNRLSRFSFSLVQDTLAPLVQVDGPEHAVTEALFHVFTGRVSDDTGVHSMKAHSDRYDTDFALLPGEAEGDFVAELPLAFGDNRITFKVMDPAGNETRVERRVDNRSPLKPRIRLLRPGAGERVFTEKLKVEGEVDTDLPGEALTLVLHGRGGPWEYRPAGQGGVHPFVFEELFLVEGPNYFDLEVRTDHGGVMLRSGVHRFVPAGEGGPPRIEIRHPQKNAMVQEDRVQVRGTVYSPDGVKGVWVNGSPARTGGSAEALHFQHTVHLGEEGFAHPVHVRAQSGLDVESSLEWTVMQDKTAPEILLDGDLRAYPEMNEIVEQGWMLSGRILEPHPGGLRIGQSPLALSPAGEGVWSFATGLDLNPGVENTLRLVAWDRAGNRTEKLLGLLFMAARRPEILSPQDGAVLVTGQRLLTLPLICRVPDLEPEDRVALKLDGILVPDLAFSGTTGRAGLVLDGAPGSHSLELEVLNAEGRVLGRTRSSFQIQDEATLPLSLELRPGEGETGVAPGAFVSLSFNRMINPDALEVVLEETAHTLNYKETEPGRGIEEMGEIPMERVNREREPVPGGLSWFPEKTLAAFYPERDFAWGATVHVTVRYQGEEILRNVFTVRPLPTFLQGFVTDTRMTPLAGVRVRLAKPDLSVVTDKEGSFGFGFGDRAEDSLVPGTYRLEVNPGMEHPGLGSLERRVHVAGGEMNRAGMFRIPVIRGDLPMVLLGSGMGDVSLDHGELVLDLEDARLFFGDGRDKKPVTAVFLEYEEIPWPMDSVMPSWMYMLTPGPLEVEGPVGLSFHMPALYGSHDYVEAVGDRVVLVGFDPDTGSLKPAGVGLVDREARRVRSERLELRRLDALGYAFVEEGAQDLLKAYGEGLLHLADLLGRLGAGAAGTEE